MSVIQKTKPPIARIWFGGILAAVVSALVNVILFFVGSAIDAFPSDVLIPGMGGTAAPMTLMPVAIMSVLPILVATLVYTVLSRVTHNPNRWFTILAAIVFVVMLVTPFTIPGAPTLMIVFLEVMHVVAAVAAVYFLNRSV